VRVVYEIVKFRWPCRYELFVQCVPPEFNSRIKDQSINLPGSL
jgi:hypothetical protein